MAYTANDLEVRVVGTLASSESFSNTWTFQELAGDPSVDDAVDALHAFYTDLATDRWTTLVTATAASWRRLDGSASGDGSWAAIAGGVATDLIPTECALRVSLSAPNGVRGGCFLPGFGVNNLDPDGTADDAAMDDIEGALGELNTALQLANWVIAINRTSVDTVVVATGMKFGKVFDVIRRRRNQLPESYRTIALT